MMLTRSSDVNGRRRVLQKEPAEVREGQDGIMTEFTYHGMVQFKADETFLVWVERLTNVFPEPRCRLNGLN